MWIDPDIQEHELLRLRAYLEQRPFECPLTLTILQKRLDEIREWRYRGIGNGATDKLEELWRRQISHHWPELLSRLQKRIRSQTATP